MGVAEATGGAPRSLAHYQATIPMKMAVVLWSRARGLAQIRRRLNNSSHNLRLERQGGFSGGAGINQLDRMDALGFASVWEEEQSRLGKSTVPFR